MADPFTLAASTVGIISLAIHLLEKAKTAHDLWSWVKDAPAELNKLHENLKNVSQLLQEVIEQATIVDPSSRAIPFVRSCQTRLDDLRTMSGSLDLSSCDGKRAFVKRVRKIMGNDQKVLPRESDYLKPKRGVAVRRNGVKLQADRQSKLSRRHIHWRIPLILGSLIVYQRFKRTKEDERPDAANPDPSAKEYGLIFQPSWLFHSGFEAAFVSECNANTYQFRQTLRPIFYLPENHPLFIGAKNGDVQTVQHYLTTFGTANVLCTDGDTVHDSRSLLQHAISHEQIEIVRLLVESNADTNYADDDDGFTAIAWSTLFSDSGPDMARLIMRDGRAVPSEADYLEQYCWHSTNMSTALWQILAEASSPVLQQQDIESHTPLHIYSLIHGIEADVCRLAVRNGADINIPLRERDLLWSSGWEGALPLHFAIISVQVAAERPTHRSSINNVAEELLVDCFNELTDVHHFCPTARLWSPTVILADGARQNQKRKIRYLLENGANLHAISRRWGSPTDIAKLSNNLGMWYDVLKECNVELDAFLAKDSAMERTPEFYDWQNCIRERRKTRNFLQRQWLCIVDSAEKVGLGRSDGIHDFLPSEYQIVYPRGHCRLCRVPTGGHAVAACKHLYYLRFFVVVLLSHKITCSELGDCLSLISKLFEDLEEWVNCNRNDHSDDGEHERLKDVDTRIERRSESREAYRVNPDAGYKRNTEKQPYGDNEESDDGEEYGIGKEFDNEEEEGEEKTEYDDREDWDCENWHMLEIIVNVFFMTQWPRTIELDFKELSTKLRESTEEPRIPGTWPADND
ncbi:MAG: hypothetical protein M1835_003570 [Candelina submexicana]|nr:MAG: hypothetical protein M1835_003570 [Candelina submexicana]